MLTIKKATDLTNLTDSFSLSAQSVQSVAKQN
jgi:hypothetical protein